MKNFRYADQISVDDEVLAHKNDDLIPAKIINITSFTMQGDNFFKILNLFLLGS